MKKILTLVLIFILSLCLSAPTFAKIPETISKADREELNLMVDIFTICVAESVTEQLGNDTPENMVMGGFYDCSNEAKPIVTKLEELGLTREEISVEFQAMYAQFVMMTQQFIDEVKLKQKERNI